MVRDRARRRFRYYRIAGGNHVDGLYDAYPGPAAADPALLPPAFAALEGWSVRPRAAAERHPRPANLGGPRQHLLAGP